MKKILPMIMLTVTATCVFADENAAPADELARVKKEMLSAVPPAAVTAFGAIEPKPFGKLADGRETHIWRVVGVDGLVMDFTDYGGRLVRAYAPDRWGNLADVTLGWNSAAEYEKGGCSMGTLIGRFANRIADGKFKLDGKTYQLPIYDVVPTHCNLHGGPLGWDTKVWEVKPFEKGKDRGLVMSLVSPDGDMGFPGTVKIKVTYTVKPGNVWRIDYEAVTDKPTVINPTHHTYWNLAGEASGTILDQKLQIFADTFTQVDKGLIPTENVPVAGTGLDFRTLRPISGNVWLMANNPALANTENWYNHNYFLNGKAGELRPAAVVADPASGRRLEVWTTEPCMQFYGSNFMDGSLPTKTPGRKMIQFCGIALETQHAPDSPNRPDFPSTVLRPGETFRSTSEYRFGIEK